MPPEGTGPHVSARAAAHPRRGARGSSRTGRSTARPAKVARDDAAYEHGLHLRCSDGDPAAKEELVERFMPLAKRLASRYRAGTESQEDLQQVACLGLLKALDRYDPEAGPFMRFAVPTILGELKRHF